MNSLKQSFSTESANSGHWPWPDFIDRSPIYESGRGATIFQAKAFTTALPLYSHR
jgi:hypothetical protein